MGRFYSNSAFDKFLRAAGRARPPGAAVILAALVGVILWIARPAGAK